MWKIFCVLLSLEAKVRADSQSPEATWTAAQQGGADGVLLQVHVLFRHGHRVPKQPCICDPNNNNASFWDDGLSQLTNIGRRQGYDLGIGLRRRYGFILPEVRAWKNISVQSSEVPRCMMTAGTLLAGFLPPRGSDVWSDLPWQPVPVHSLPFDMDNTLYVEPLCPKLKLLSDLPLHPTHKLRKYVEEHTGMKVKTLNAFEKIYTCMEIERVAALQLPTWYSVIYPQPISSETARYLARDSATLEGARLRSGPLLAKLSDFDPSNVSTTVHLYATHDNVLANLMNALQLYTGEPPGFTAALALEYRRTANGEIHVQLWWRNAFGEPLTRLQLPGCDERCPLQYFRQTLNPLIPDDWATECQIGGEWHHRLTDASLAWWVTFSILALAALLTTLALALSRAPRHQYALLQDKPVKSYC